VATSHAIYWSGCRPVFVDIDPNTLTIDPEKIEASITPNTSAIMALHCYGHPCDTEKIQKIADKYNLKILYDACHSFGVKDSKGSVLRHGDLSVLSFHATKVFNTFEGGAIICHDRETKTQIDQLKNFGIVDETTVVAPGINGKMSEINASFGLLQLKYIGQVIKRRAAVDAQYRKSLFHVPGIRCLQHSEVSAHNYSYFPILVENDYPISRDELFRKLKNNGINGRRYFFPLITEFPMYRGLQSANPVNLPVATRTAAQVICLPLYPDLPPEVVEQICRLISEQ
jgi:dTDP-4-amino-4,6-dideoxygalactose transaminase